ncbi:MAG: hypothetical protein AUJ28_01895 [Parcubacteria group bacterium CG1_02_37_51]|uniref:Uncharacterized protein n=2 Tax=Candidatus Komeiliibacteriota TaxID=1817908 RepID=A0A2M8DS16_9BACT|nr:MAG: hypothetical protein AUJ28_01895 [Parcubacteria group bacterium CG1_02_37_51]PIY94215.1 MAG: hypothetical protein COY67_03050 [Candidatus Komeilibacteria bacterium CG_4_10_14_0_8_um_filter_37_78]PJC02161.1 MAG: hypothetical protein CO073_00930 [Candidatus Komeilibacteria bacterium CG_4_9_14_0_8_um_filter_36_9]
MKIAITAFLSIIVLMCSFANGKKTQIDENGYLHEIEVSSRDLTSEEIEAMENPGKEIFIDGKTMPSKRVSFFYIMPITQYNGVIIYDEKAHQIFTIPITTVIEGEKTIAVYIVLLLVAIVLMMTSNILFWRYGSNSVAFVFAAADAFVFAAAAAAAFVFAAAAVAVAVAAAVVADAAVDEVKKERKIHILFSVLFYIAAIIAMYI